MSRVQYASEVLRIPWPSLMRFSYFSFSKLKLPSTHPDSPSSLLHDVDLDSSVEVSVTRAI